MNLFVPQPSFLSNMGVASVLLYISFTNQTRIDMLERKNLDYLINVHTNKYVFAAGRSACALT